MKITVAELLKQYNIPSWYGLFKRGRGSISKSMARDWVIGAHQPNRKSAIKIAYALGLPPAQMLSILQTRERQENHPVPAVFCPTCSRKLYKLPSRGEAYAEPQTL